MSVRCVLVLDDEVDDVSAHSEQEFVAVPSRGDTISIIADGQPAIFFVTSVMHCAAGTIPSESGPIAHLTISRQRPAGH